VSRERQDLTEPDRRPRRRLDETVAIGGRVTPPQGMLMPDFRTCTLVWGGGHALQRARERGVDPDAVEAIVRGSTDLEPGHHGRWIVWGCAGGRRIMVVVRPVSVDRCIIVTIIRTGAPCI
jgi:hypothetical protein